MYILKKFVLYAKKCWKTLRIRTRSNAKIRSISSVIRSFEKDILTMKADLGEIAYDAWEREIAMGSEIQAGCERIAAKKGEIGDMRQEIERTKQHETDLLSDINRDYLEKSLVLLQDREERRRQAQQQRAERERAEAEYAEAQSAAVREAPIAPVAPDYRGSSVSAGSPFTPAVSPMRGPGGQGFGPGPAAGAAGDDIFVNIIQDREVGSEAAGQNEAPSACGGSWAESVEGDEAPVFVGSEAGTDACTDDSVDELKGEAADLGEGSGTDEKEAKGEATDFSEEPETGEKAASGEVADFGEAAGIGENSVSSEATDLGGEPGIDDNSASGEEADFGEAAALQESAESLPAPEEGELPEAPETAEAADETDFSVFSENHEDSKKKKRPKFCPFCGAENTSRSKTCKSCRKKF